MVDDDVGHIDLIELVALAAADRNTTQPDSFERREDGLCELDRQRFDFKLEDVLVIVLRTLQLNSIHLRRHFSKRSGHKLDK